MEHKLLTQDVEEEKMRMLAEVIRSVDWVFGCHHGSLSRVFTIGGRTYKVCLDCGRQFDYSWQSMSVKPAAPRLSLVPKPVEAGPEKQMRAA